MPIDTKNVVDLRGISAGVVVHGAAVYIALDANPKVPVIRCTSVRDALAASEAFIEAAKALRELETAMRSAAREAM